MMAATISRNSTAPGIIGLPGKWPSADRWPTAKCLLAVIVAEALSPSGALLGSCICNQTLDLVARQLAKRIARQSGDKADRSRQKRGVDPAAKLREDEVGIAS